MELKQIVTNLKKYNPEKIVLFGSYAWGKPKRNSDIDLLIIKNTKKIPTRERPRRASIFTA
jgi:predicted nucleotidyltransferase